MPIGGSPQLEDTIAKLREMDWNVSETARVLDMPRSNLYKKIERYALTREST